MNSVPQSSEVPSLRGPEAQRIGGRFWFATGALLLTAFAVVIIVSFISATNDNSRIHRLKTRGVSVVVTVTNCVGNIGGSGSNASGYTCHGSYLVKGANYQEVIGSKSTLSSVGSRYRESPIPPIRARSNWPPRSHGRRHRPRSTSSRAFWHFSWSL